jgi:small subunit ribosomal protein S17
MSQITGSDRGRPQRKVGMVISKSGAKTVKVRVDRAFAHPLYKRVIRRSKGFLVHDEHEVCGIGDKVEIIECRPLSAQKRFRLRRIISRPAGVEPVPAELGPLQTRPDRGAGSKSSDAE